MTTIDLPAVRKISTLARLGLAEDELPRYAAQLSKIMGFVEQLNEVNTDNVAPLANVSDIALKLRDDAVTDGNIQQDVLANAPEALEGFYVVQKVVE